MVARPVPPTFTKRVHDRSGPIAPIVRLGILSDVTVLDLADHPGVGAFLFELQFSLAPLWAPDTEYFLETSIVRNAGNRAFVAKAGPGTTDPPVIRSGLDEPDWDNPDGDTGLVADGDLAWNERGDADTHGAGPCIPRIVATAADDGRVVILHPGVGGGAPGDPAGSLVLGAAIRVEGEVVTPTGHDYLERTVVATGDAAPYLYDAERRLWHYVGSNAAPWTP